MSPNETPSQRTAAWLMAGGMWLHILLMRPSATLSLAVGILLVGAALRCWRLHVPNWLGRALLLLTILILIFRPTRLHPGDLLGELSAVFAALLLLLRLTPSRGQWILLCLLGSLLALILQFSSQVGTIFVIANAAFLLILAEQIHRPPEAAISLWTSLQRSLRVVVPVASLITLIFWFFPDISIQSPRTSMGFSGAGVMNPGEVAEINSSHRIALIARFPENQPIPTTADLYWRGQILEKNEGFRWRRESVLGTRPHHPPDESSRSSRVNWRYIQELHTQTQGTIPALEQVQSLQAFRAGQPVRVVDLGGFTLAAAGRGPLTLEVHSSAEPARDDPKHAPEGALGVPAAVANDPELRKIANALISPNQTTPAHLAALARFLRESGFTYTLRPGRIRTEAVTEFLTKRKRGFCEHYAAASANLLRLGGVPARIVTGYRGGDWNPWRRTLTVRDADAHAWLEAWDPASQSWLRFDPTVYVAPELTSRQERNLLSEHWPWYRQAFMYAKAQMERLSEGLAQLYENFLSSEAWGEWGWLVLLVILLGLSLWQFSGPFRHRLSSVDGIPARFLKDLELAAPAHQLRQPGETPLAWLNRLRESSCRESETTSLIAFAAAYQRCMYQKENPALEEMKPLRQHSRILRKLWRRSRKAP